MVKTVLIAATDPNIIYLLQRYAEESGFHAVRCGNEKNLLHLVKQVKPALIVLQAEPPEANWRKSLKSLKDDPDTRLIPIVAYSCFDETINSQVDGIIGFLQKSVLYSDFVSALEQAGVHAD